MTNDEAIQKLFKTQKGILGVVRTQQRALESFARTIDCHHKILEEILLADPEQQPEVVSHLRGQMARASVDLEELKRIFELEAPAETDGSKSDKES